MKLDDLEKLRNSKTEEKTETVKFEQKSPAGIGELHDLKDDIVFDALHPLDLQCAQTYYKVDKFDKAYRGENFVCRSSTAGYKMLPAVIPEKVEEKKPEQPKKEKFDYVQGETLELDDLLEKTPEVIKNNNCVGLYEYLFIKELVACKNGFLYYLLPLLFGIVGLIFSFLHSASVVYILYNCISALIVLTAVLVILPVFKDATLTVGKLILCSVGFILIATGFALLLAFVPEFRAEISFYVVIRLLVILFDLYYTAKFYAIFIKCYIDDCKTNFANVVTVNAGQPRVGKTSEAVNEAIVLAHLQWGRLRKEFKRWHSREDKILARANFEELTYYNHLKESYSVNIMSACIPCLFSSTGIEDKKGRKSHELTLDHIRGLKKLPLYCVLFMDEIGAYIKAELSQDKERPYDISDMFRLGGHYLKWIVLASEQDFSNIYIDCRRVVGYNRIVLSQEKVNNPIILQKIYDFLTFFEEENSLYKIKRNPKWSAFLDKFESLINSIGFRKYTFSYVTNTETGAEVKNVKSRCVKYTPSCLLGQYAQEAFRYQYPALYDKGIEFKTHESLYISYIDGKGDQFVSKTKSVAEKRKQVRARLNTLYQQIENLKGEKNENNVPTKKAG